MCKLWRFMEAIMKKKSYGDGETTDTHKSTTTTPESPAAQPSATAARPSQRSLAELRLVQRSSSFFRAMADDALLREQFATDPARIISDYLHGSQASDEEADCANQLVYAAVSSPSMREWMFAVAQDESGRSYDEAAFARGFAHAAARSADPLVALALVRNAASGEASLEVSLTTLRSIIGALGRIRAGTEVSPGGGTEVSPGGTEVSPGALFRGTEMSPGFGTEMSGTHMSPGAVFTGTDQSPGFGTEVSGTHKSPGFASVTEMSPGPDPGTEQSGTHISPGAVFTGPDITTGFGTEVSGTHISPGTAGTNISPGHSFEFLSRDIAISFNALVRFATQARSAGALNVTGFERFR